MITTNTRDTRPTCTQCEQSIARHVDQTVSSAGGAEHTLSLGGVVGEEAARHFRGTQLGACHGCDVTKRQTFVTSNDLSTQLLVGHDL